jgi:hypothetical protein
VVAVGLGSLLAGDGRNVASLLLLDGLAGAGAVPGRVALDDDAGPALHGADVALAVVQHRRVRRELPNLAHGYTRQRAETQLLHTGHLAHDFQVRGHQSVQVAVERARDGVLHGQHAERELTALHGLHHVRHVRQPHRHELGGLQCVGRLELLEGRFGCHLRERSLLALEAHEHVVGRRWWRCNRVVLNLVLILGLSLIPSLSLRLEPLVVAIG